MYRTAGSATRFNFTRLIHRGSGAVARNPSALLRGWCSGCGSRHSGTANTRVAHNVRACGWLLTVCLRLWSTSASKSGRHDGEGSRGHCAGRGSVDGRRGCWRWLQARVGKEGSGAAGAAKGTVAGVPVPRGNTHVGNADTSACALRQILYSAKDLLALVLFGTDGASRVPRGCVPPSVVTAGGVRVCGRLADTENSLAEQLGGYEHVKVERDMGPPTVDLLRSIPGIKAGAAEGDWLDACA